MQSKYKFYIVVDGNKQAISMTETYVGEEEAKGFMRTMADTKSIWIGLENGNMISVNNLTGSVYFVAEALPHDTI